MEKNGVRGSFLLVNVKILVPEQHGAPVEFSQYFLTHVRSDDLLALRPVERAHPQDRFALRSRGENGVIDQRHYSAMKIHFRAPRVAQPGDELNVRCVEPMVDHREGADALAISAHENAGGAGEEDAWH